MWTCALSEILLKPPAGVPLWSHRHLTRSDRRHVEEVSRARKSRRLSDSRGLGCERRELIWKAIPSEGGERGCLQVALACTTVIKKMRWFPVEDSPSPTS